MNVREAIEFLSRQDPEGEIVIYNPLVKGGYQTRLGTLQDGYFVFDNPGDSLGIFVDSESAVKPQWEDGKPLLDLTSSTIKPAVTVRVLRWNELPERPEK